MPDARKAAMPTQPENPMKELLKFGAPPTVDKTPKSFFFNREREIEVDWRTELAGAGWLEPEANAHLVDYVTSKHSGEFSWAKSQVGTWLTELTAAAAAYVHEQVEIEIFRQAELNKGTGQIYFTVQEQRTAPVSKKAIPISQGVVLRIDDERGGERHYLPLKADGKAVMREAFETDWADAWKNVAALQLVYFGANAEADAKLGFTFTEVVRSDEALLLQRYAELDIERELASKYKELALALSEKIKSSTTQEIEYIAEQYRELMSFARSVDSRIQALADAARRMGYYLVTKPGDTVPYYDEDGYLSNPELEPGDLYRTHETVRTWNIQHVSHSKDWKGHVSYSHWSSPATRTFDRYVKVEVDTRPWEKLLNSYRTQGFETHLFNRDRYGRLSTTSGLPVSTIVDELERDESRRRRTVLAFPIIEESVLGDEVIVAYQIFGRPLPDFKRSTLPSLRVREDLSYRFAWRGTSVGELAATIPLSPGEEREVTAVISTSDESRESYTSTSLLDVSREDKTDFESTFERELKKETESKQSASAELKGSYGAASGSAKVSQEKTTKELARTLEKAVRKASSKVNSQQRTEIKIERSNVRTQATSSTITYKVKNINDAATLNIAFFRLMNNYDSLLCVEDFSIQVESGRSLLAGWDVYDQQHFELDDVDALVDHLALPGNFPGRAKPWSDVEKQNIANSIAKLITKTNELTVGKELLTDADQAELRQEFSLDGGSRAQEFLSRSSIESVSTLKDNEAQSAIAKVGELRRSTLSKIRSRAREIKFEEEPSSFMLDSGGLYADVIMGVGIGADDYAQERRKLELSRVEADIDLTNARANWLRSRTAKV